MDLDDYKEELAGRIEAAAMEAIEELEDAMRLARNKVEKATTEAIHDIEDPDPTLFLETMGPADLANYVAGRMEAMSSLELDEFKRHLQQSLFPLGVTH